MGTPQVGPQEGVGGSGAVLLPCGRKGRPGARKRESGHKTQRNACGCHELLQVTLSMLGGVCWGPFLCSPDGVRSNSDFLGFTRTARDSDPHPHQMGFPLMTVTGLRGRPVVRAGQRVGGR